MNIAGSVGSDRIASSRYKLASRRQSTIADRASTIAVTLHEPAIVSACIPPTRVVALRVNLTRKTSDTSIQRLQPIVWYTRKFGTTHAYGPYPTSPPTHSFPPFTKGVRGITPWTRENFLNFRCLQVSLSALCMVPFSIHCRITIGKTSYRSTP